MSLVVTSLRNGTITSVSDQIHIDVPLWTSLGLLSSIHFSNRAIATIKLGAFSTNTWSLKFGQRKGSLGWTYCWNWHMTPRASTSKRTAPISGWKLEHFLAKQTIRFNCSFVILPTTSANQYLFLEFSGLSENPKSSAIRRPISLDYPQIYAVDYKTNVNGLYSNKSMTDIDILSPGDSHYMRTVVASAILVVYVFVNMHALLQSFALCIQIQ